MSILVLNIDEKFMQLLNNGNAKTIKGEKYGYDSYGSHLKPFKSLINGKTYNACPFASKGCAEACLNTAGRGQMSNVQQARLNKTRLFFTDRERFMNMLHKEISKKIRRSEKRNMKPCFRLNLTSDIAWESVNHRGKNIMEHFPSVQFYDYTKSSKRTERYLDGKMPSNYQLTFSRSECNGEETEKILKKKGNVAVVFRNRLPKTWKGYRVIDGDDSDLRFLDSKNVIVGLVEKGLAKKDSTGFVIG